MLAEKNLSFNQIENNLDHQWDLAKQIIKKLHGMKLIKVMNCETKKIEDGEYAINPEFTSDKKEIIIILDPTKEIEDYTLSTIQFEKEESLRCAIVKELKQKKSMKKDELVRNITAKFSTKWDVKIEEIELALEKLEGKYLRKEMNGNEITLYYL